MGETTAADALVPKLSDYLDHLAASAHERLGEVAGVAVTLGVSGAPMTVGSSTGLALEVDLIQYEVGTGPCLKALKEGVGTYVPDLGSDGRWGEYGRRAAARGAASCVSIPVLVRGDPTAVLKVYSGKIDGLSAYQQRTAGCYAAEVAGGVALARSLTEQARELDDRSAAMDSRRVIDMAIGILMERAALGPAEAFDLLRRQSQASNTKVRDVARKVISSARGPNETARVAPFNKRGIAPRP
ncbi:MAG: hypothetical protein AVDCRST_MAG75-44 [uncultured Propionibacteriaceae bacterium]|uniref:ANTAR domain-containing protein n=1 Tax=uncultured Propionibacteriaceae bacterium TaxID=257457 RepID=A0A6J4MY32_9ACTN|nr:MAG: hypothetical protein AVDCRST_MAG75-44 [uncultured Propionibacteriaceae bacterium]